MEQKDIKKKIRALIQLDIDAAHAYQQAIDRIEQPSIKDQLTAFRRDHERHVFELSAKLSEMGEQPPDSPDIKGYLIEGFTGLRSATGTAGAFKAMQGNEKLTNRKYAEAEEENFPADLRRIIANNRKDEARHLRYIEQTLTEKSWEKRSTSMHGKLFETLKKDHREVRDLFTRIREAESPDERRSLVDTLRKEILPHMIGEEKVIYAALKERPDPWSDALESIEEHHAAQMLLRELAATPPDDERFRAKATVLKEMVEHHVEEEEIKIFRDLQEVLDDRRAGEVLEGFTREKEMAKSNYPNIPAVTSESPEMRVH